MISPIPPIYHIWEDAIGEKTVVLKRGAHLQHVYIANYEWVVFADNKKLRVMADFEDEIDVECRIRVRILYGDDGNVLCSRNERRFCIEEGVAFDIVSPKWTSIEVAFRVVKINGIEYKGPTEEPFFSAVVTVDDKRVRVNVEQLTLESEVFNGLKAISNGSEITIFDLDSDLFLELLRVINRPRKRISRHNFVDLLLLATRFRMPHLLSRLEDFTKTPEYDKRWVNKWTLKRIDKVLSEEPTAKIQVLDGFRAQRRAERPAKKVAFSEPEVLVIAETKYTPGLPEHTSCQEKVVEYLTDHKTYIIYTLFSVLLFENFILLIWFGLVHRGSD